MRIAWITPGIAANENEHRGASAITNLLKRLAAYEDLEVTVFSLYYPENAPPYNLFGCKIYAFGRKPEPGRFDKLIIWNKCINAFGNEHKQKKFDLIHSMWSGESGYISSMLSKKHTVPLITNINGGELGKLEDINFGSQIKFFQKYFVGKSFRQAEVIVCGSDFVASKIRLYYDKEILSKLKRIPFGVDENLFKADLPLIYSLERRGGILRIINIANAVPVKSHIDLFKAFKIVLQKFPDSKLICCGLDKNNVLPKLANKLEISANVEIKGFVDYQSLPQLLRNSVLFVLSSLYESQNMAILEAAFFGLPVVSTNVGVAPEIASNIVKAGDYMSLAEKIIYVIENYDVERIKAENNLASLRERFSINASSEEFYEMYKGLILS